MEIIQIRFGTNWILISTKETGAISSNLKVEDSPEDMEYNAAIDGLESLILAHACAGVDVASKKYVEGIETALDAILNNLA